MHDLELITAFSGYIRAVSKERPRSSRGGHFYTPKKTREYEDAIKAMITAIYDGEPVDFPVAIQMKVLKAVPKSWPQWKRDAALVGDIYPNRGDLDNKFKAVTDAMNGLVYVDDSQISHQVITGGYDDRDFLSVKVWRNGITLEEARDKYGNNRRRA